MPDVLSPMCKIQTVFTRPDGRSFPNVQSVIPILTPNPAILLQHDDKTGSTGVDKAADLVVLDKNSLEELSVEEIHTARVILTCFKEKQSMIQIESREKPGRGIPRKCSLSHSLFLKLFVPLRMIEMPFRT
jgi:hypothetical protein